MPTKKNRRYDQALERLNQAVHRIIEERRRTSPVAADLLSILMAAKDDETGSQMSDQQLRDEVMTFFWPGTNRPPSR